MNLPHAPHTPTHPQYTHMKVATWHTYISGYLDTHSRPYPMLGLRRYYVSLYINICINNYERLSISSITPWAHDHQSPLTDAKVVTSFS